MADSGNDSPAKFEKQAPFEDHGAALLWDALDSPIAFHRSFVKFGGVHAALMLSQALYWQKRCPEGRNGWWWKTKKDWQEETGLNREEQDTARNRLVSCGVLEVKRGAPASAAGGPACLCFRVNYTVLSNLLPAEAQKAGIPPNKKRESLQTKSGNPSKPHSEITPKTSPERNPSDSYCTAPQKTGEQVLLVSQEEAAPYLLEFPIKNTNGSSSWGLTEKKLKEYRESFEVSSKLILLELRSARQWLCDNPARRKTARGMPRFLTGWLSRKNDRGWSSSPSSPPRAPEPAAPYHRKMN